MKTKEFVSYVNDHTLADRDDFFTMNALAGELGELANVVKKAEFYKTNEQYRAQVDADIAAGKRQSFDYQFKDEMGDTLFYLIQMMNKWGVNIHDVMEQQSEKIDNQFSLFGKTFKK